MTRSSTPLVPETAEDGALRAQAALDELVKLLDLEQLEVNLFRGVSPPQSPTRVFGGQVAGQALVAAGRTVPADRGVHSLQAYFIRPGDPRAPIIYEAERVRDGRSFTTRRVLAIQHGEPIFSLSASFQLPQEGLEHSDPAPSTVLCAAGPIWSSPRGGASDEPVRVWMRADGKLPDDRLLHVCLLTY